MLNGIIQWLRLRLDPASKDRAVEDARRAGRDVAEGFGEEGKKSGDKVETGIKKGLRDAEDAAERSAKRMGGFFFRMAGGIRSAFSGIGGLIAGAFAGYALKQFITDMWELGTAAGETQSKFNTTFGKEGASQVQDFIDKWGTLAGLNNTMAQEFTSTAGAIVQGMGASQQASAKFSEQILRAAGDLQSFHNVPIEQTFNALRSGLTGETEPLKRFGILLRAADVEQRALIATGKGHKDQLTGLERAQASFNIILEQMGPALGDLERTQDSTANKARNLKAEYENLRIELAERLLPIFASLIDNVTENKKEIGEAAETVWVLSKLVGGVLWQAFHSVANLLAGAWAVAMGTALGFYHSMEIIVLRLVQANEELNRVFGMGSDAAVQAAKDAVSAAEAKDRYARALVREGLKTQVVGTWAAEQVWNFKPAEGQFNWEDARRDPLKPPAPPVDPADAKRAERERTAELAAQVRLLEEMAERREQFPTLVQEAAALERQLTAELDSGNITTRRRVDLMNQIGTLQEIIAGNDRHSIQREDQRRDNLEKQVGLAEEMFRVYGDTADVIAHAGMLEAALYQELTNENTEWERQLEILKLIDQLREARVAAAPLTPGEEHEKLTQEILEHYALVGDAMVSFAEGWADAWQEAFERVVMEGGSAADAILAFGRVMGSSMLGALSTYARGKMQENVASGIEQLAKAAAAAATPGMQWAVPGHLKSAASHGLAVAAWGVLAGAAGAAQSMVGGGAGATSGGRIGGGRVDRTETVAPHVVVYIDPNDPFNPAFQRIVYEANEMGSHRVGENARVHVRPRTSQ